MKILRYIGLAAAIALVIGGAFAINSRAASAADDSALGGKWRQRIKEELNLTSEQVAQIKAQLKSEKGNITSILSRLHDARAELRAEIQKSDATEASVRNAAAKVSAVEADMAVERMKLHAKISPLLTADQRTKLAQLESGMDQFIERAISRVVEKLSE